MNEKKRKLQGIVTIMIFVGISVLTSIMPLVKAEEIDFFAKVSRVIDGDTFETEEIIIRLADIDAPEYGENGYYTAKWYLEGLIENHYVGVDVDDIYTTDQYGRYVCVVYVHIPNTDYVMNVNKALLVEGVAVIDDYPNEFNPYLWTLFVHVDAIPEFSSFVIMPLFMIATLGIAIVYTIRSHNTLGLSRGGYN